MVNELLQGHVQDRRVHQRPTPSAAQTAANAELTKLLGKGLKSALLAAFIDGHHFTNDPIAYSLAADAQHAVAVGLLQPVNLNGIYDLGPLNALLTADGQPQVSP